MGDESGGAAGAAGRYGSLAGARGEEESKSDGGDAGTSGGEEGPGSSSSSSFSEGRNHFSVLLCLTCAFVVLTCVGVWLNASGRVTLGPHAPKPQTYVNKAIRKLSICDVHFCDSGENNDSIKSPDELAACSAKVRDVANAKGIIEMRITIQFENPTHLPVQLDSFILSFRRDILSSSSSSSSSWINNGGEDNDGGNPLLGDCRATEGNVTISPEGLNQLRASCSLRVSDVADAAAEWWDGAEIRVRGTWAANVTLAPEGQRVVTSEIGNAGEDPVRFSVPRRPSSGGIGDDIMVTVNKDKGTAGGRAAAADAAAGAAVSLGSAATTTLDPAAEANRGGGDVTRLSTLFGGTGGGLFPSLDSPAAGQCPGVMDLRVGSPSFWLCDVGFESGWRETFSKCAGGRGGAVSLLESWGAGECGELMKEVVMSVRLVVDNPSDLHVTISEFKSRVWLSGHDGSAGSGWLQKVETLTPRTNTTLEFKVSIPWRGSLGELQDVMGKWWKGESLEAFFNAEFDARALGVSLHIAVPDVKFFVKFTIPTAGGGGGGGGDQQGGSTIDDSSSSGGGRGGGGSSSSLSTGRYSSSSSSSSSPGDLLAGGCVCLLGVCDFIPTHPPPSGISTWAGKSAGKGCLLSAQCASHKCSWLFKCD